MPTSFQDWLLQNTFDILPRMEMTDRYDRLTTAVALCEEFSHHVRLLHNGRLVVLLHDKWRLELEDRLRLCGFRFSSIRAMGPLQVVTVVDRFR